MNSTSCDVLVIGAGPGGSVASSLLARAGHRVLMLEAGTFPRFQIGESLLPRSSDLLEEAGLLEAVARRGYQVKRAALFLNGPQRERFCFADMFPGQRPQTYQVPRADFDQTLATAARGHGVDVRFNHRVEAVELGAEASRVTALDVEGGTPLHVDARFVLDCSGYGRVLPRLLKLEKPSVLNPRLALFTWMEGDLRPTDETDGDIWIVTHPRGIWGWVIPFSNGRTSVGLVMERAVYESVPGCDRDRLLSLLREDENLAARFAHAAPVLATAKLEGWSAAVEKLHGPGWAVTGNASEFLDPIFSSGVTLAMESASRAAKLVDQQLRGQPADWERDYDAKVQQAVGVFRTYVRAWYDGTLQRVLLHAHKSEKVKRSITSILGGYVLDDENPLVRNPDQALAAVRKLL